MPWGMKWEQSQLNVGAYKVCLFILCTYTLKFELVINANVTLNVVPLDYAQERIIFHLTM